MSDKNPEKTKEEEASTSKDSGEEEEVGEASGVDLVTNAVRNLNFDPNMIHFAQEEPQLEENYGAMICDCEYFEEAHPLAAHLAPLYLANNEGEVELMCACEDDTEAYEAPPVEYALHCCCCGVQLVPDDPVPHDHGHDHGHHHNHDHEHHNNHDHEHHHNHDHHINDEQEHHINHEHPVDHDQINQNQNNALHNHRETPPRQNPDDERQPDEARPGNQEPNVVPEGALLPPPPPPVLRLDNQPPRLLLQSTTMSPFTLLKALSCEDGGPFDTRLHEAARCGDLGKLRRLLEEENLMTNLNSKIKPFMSTPLREAVAGGCLECVRLLLSKGAEVDTVDIKGQTALFLASSLGYPATMEELLKKGANPEGSSLNSTCPLMLCVRDGCLEGVEVLLKYGVDPQPVSATTTCVPGWPLQHCIVYKNYRCFVALLRGGAETSLLRVIQSRMGLDPQDQEGLEPGMMQRLSITRTVLRHASDIPEFLLAYREFGGTFDGMQLLPEDMKNPETPAVKALRFCSDNPCSLKSLSRLKLFKTIGAKKLTEACSTLRLPPSLSMYLRYEDLYDFKTY